MSDCDNESQKVREEMWTGNLSSETIESAIKKCQFSAEKGNVNSQYHLSMLYYIRNNEHEDENSYMWTLAAANNGHAYSQYRLGILYERGEVVREDPEEALKWFQKAARNGLPLAQKKLDTIQTMTK